MTRKRATDTAEAQRKALSFLVQALTTDEDGVSRLDMVEEALTLATLALGAPEVDTAKLEDAMETLATQVLVNNLERHDHVCQRISLVCEHGDENAVVIVTTNPDLANKLDGVIQLHATEGEAPPTLSARKKSFDVN